MNSEHNNLKTDVGSRMRPSSIANCDNLIQHRTKMENSVPESRTDLIGADGMTDITDDKRRPRCTSLANGPYLKKSILEKTQKVRRSDTEQLSRQRHSRRTAQKLNKNLMMSKTINTTCTI
jgi:hypothetical protein